MAWVGLMAKLTDLGFAKGAIFETIVSTYNKNGAPNAAPMGIIMQNSQTLSLNIFNSSQTSRNLKANKCGVINLTSNIEFFYKTAFKEANPDGKLPQEWFGKAEAVNAPQLLPADATIAFSVVSMQPIGAEKTKFTCNIEQITSAEMCPQVYCRAMSATLEAIIHATRVKAFINDEKQKKYVGHLLELIENCNDVVDRTAPNSSYSLVMADLMEKIDSWSVKR
ncbi:MAG: DUF447 family protein [Candidatus Bathyarchaeota archaeon]|nr:DUF447 family protein [Candidatus Bathyarchaeota archaeon]